MNICIVSNLYPPYYVGGFEVRCGQVADALAQRGHQVTVITSRHGVSERCVEGVNPRIHRVLSLYCPFSLPGSKDTVAFRVNRTKRWWVTRRNQLQTAKLLRKIRPDVVFVWSPSRLSLGSVRAIQALGLPSAWTIGDPNLREYQPVRWTRKLHSAPYYLDRTLFQRDTWTDLPLANVHCVSQDLKRRLLEMGLPVERACVFYRGIPIDQFPARGDIGSLHTPPRILFVGQLHPWKGVHTLLEATNALCARHGNDFLTVTIAGEGEEPFKAQLRQLARGASNVRFLGKVPHDQLSAVYREHDIFVFPSAGNGYEGFPATPIEAMASGLPVIGTLSGGQAELLADHKNALIFEAEDANGLADCLATMINDDELRSRLARTGRAQVEQHYTIGAYIDEMEAFLKRAARATGC